MANARVRNAQRARGAVAAARRAVVVTGDEASRAFWADTLGARSGDAGPSDGGVIAEQGRKGNFLGALQAYERLQQDAGSRRTPGLDQLVMFVGSGTRLSPLTQSLRNMKAALPLPDGNGAGASLSVGEAAVRSSAPWIEALRDRGFDGLIIRWGDEILVPSLDFDSLPSSFGDVDAVRFAYRVTPTEVLARHKEWLVSDDDATVQAELPRQPLERLSHRVAAVAGAHAVHVNLGSFAISHDLLSALVETFQPFLSDAETAANWDPYLWMALHSETEERWRIECCVEPGVLPPDLTALLERIPDFWRRAYAAKRRLQTLTGRPLTVKLLDFGDPYWFDAGHLDNLQSGLADIFAAGQDGDTLRALLGLDPALASGGSQIHDSTIAPGATVRNSLVIDSHIEDADSALDRAIVVNSRVVHLDAQPGSVVIDCSCDSLHVAGPKGMAFRVVGDARVSGSEVTATVGLPPDSVRLTHPDLTRSIDDDSYSARLGSNPISYREAAALAEGFDPVQLRDFWRDRGPEQ